MKNKFLKLCLTLVLFAGMLASVMAQVTTSGISGRITSNNESLPGLQLLPSTFRRERNMVQLQILMVDSVFRVCVLVVLTKWKSHL